MTELRYDDILQDLNHILLNNTKWGLLLTFISALALSTDLMLSVLLHIYKAYAQQNQKGTNVTLPREGARP
jgi:hypothetical protein